MEYPTQEPGVDRSLGAYLPHTDSFSLPISLSRRVDAPTAPCVPLSATLLQPKDFATEGVATVRVFRLKLTSFCGG